jgi:hypothetical protein
MQLRAVENQCTITCTLNGSTVIHAVVRQTTVEYPNNASYRLRVSFCSSFFLRKLHIHKVILRCSVVHDNISGLPLHSLPTARRRGGVAVRISLSASQQQAEKSADSIRVFPCPWPCALTLQIQAQPHVDRLSMQ